MCRSSGDLSGDLRRSTLNSGEASRGFFTMRKRGKRSFESVGAQNITEDLLIAILSFLPTRSLSRFRCVSKAWNNLITYVCSQRKILLPVSGLLISLGSKGRYVSVAPDQHLFGEGFWARLRSLPFASGFQVAHSCNGLILFARINGSRVPYLYLWNPVTMEFFAIPEQPTRMYACWDSFLAYDPRESPHYSIVRFIVVRSSPIIKVEIYSSKTGSWRKDIVFSQNSIRARWHNMSVFHKGSLYFLPVDPLDSLIRFDIEDRRFYFLNFPVRSRHEYSMHPQECIGESREHLHYAVNFCQKSVLEIYMLKELDRCRWLLLHKINYNNEMPTSDFRLMAFHPESEVIYLHVPGKILSYHLCNRTLEEVQAFGFDDETVVDSTVVFSVFPCLESINPPGGCFFNPFTLRNALGCQAPVSEIKSSSRGCEPDAGDSSPQAVDPPLVVSSAKSPHKDKRNSAETCTRHFRAPRQRIGG